MRIVLVNWARIWDGASYGGGVNQYCQALALELVGLGHEVVSLFGGTTFTNVYQPGEELPKPGACEIRRHPDWLGVKIFEVVNSPVMAPGIVQFEQPLGEIICAELEARVGEFFAALKPDVVHWNNIEGFSAGCVDAARRSSGARQIFSLHNYHTICPQVYLMQGHTRACHSFDNGHACATCIGHPKREQERAKHADAHDKAAGVDPTGITNAKNAWLGAMGTFKRIIMGPLEIARAKQAQERVRLSVAPPGRRVALRPDERYSAGGETGLTVHEAYTIDQDTRGKTPHLMAELNPSKRPDPNSPERLPLFNIVKPDLPTDKPLNDYGKRRHGMVAMLNSCDRVLAVSDFVQRKFESMGVDTRVIRTLAIGSRINRVIDLKPDLLFPPPELLSEPATWHEQRPLRLHFMGYNNYYKGLHIVADALEMLDAAHLRQIDLSIFALDGHRIEWMFRRLEPRLAKLNFRGEYNYHDIPWMLGGRDMTLVPSVWWDNAPQTVFESLSCGVPVLGANVGGIPDFVTHGVNGLLFTGNSRESLRDTLVHAIENPREVWNMRKNRKPCKSIKQHALEMVDVYQGKDEELYAHERALRSAGQAGNGPEVSKVRLTVNDRALRTN